MKNKITKKNNKLIILKTPNKIYIFKNDFCLFITEMKKSVF